LKKWLRDHFGREILTAQTRGRKGDGNWPETEGTSYIAPVKREN
jgi:hypothetical protein